MVVGGTVDDKATPWERVHDEDGLIIDTRRVPGTNVFELRAEQEMPYPSHLIWEVLLDVDRYGEFMPYVVVSKVIEKVSDELQYEYHLRDPPFIARRDWVVEVKMEAYEDTGLYIVSWDLAPNKGPPLPRRTIRMVANRGHWVLEPTRPGFTRVGYLAYASPGGSIPTTVVNYANRKGLPGLFEAVEGRAEEMSRRKK